MGWVEERETVVAAVASDVGEAVVTVGRGSGVVVSPGIVATNAHNLPGAQPPIVWSDGRTATGEVAAADLDGDLAVVRVDTGDTPTLAPGEVPARLGQVVVALARPRHRGLIATVGGIAATGARFRGPRGGLVTGAFEHDARVPRGASGGPVVDTDGRLLGIDTHRRRDGFYVAIAAGTDLRTRLDALAEGHVTPRARLGIAVAPPHVARRLRAAVGLEERDGILVREVEADGPAARAGLAEGDLLVAADGVALTSVVDLHEALAAATGPLSLTVVRGAEERDVVVEVLP